MNVAPETDGDVFIRAVGSVALGLRTPADCAERYGLDPSLLGPFVPASAQAARSPELSVVIPAYDEEAGLALL